MAVLEAWANAKPALITPQCNLSEGVAAGAAIEVEMDSAAIMGALNRLFRTDGRKLEAIGNRGRNLVSRRFAWSKIVTDLKSVYYWLHGGPKPECIVAH
jgi:poly(glycerol-phosphate) alpha-glucosyltransferase